MKIWIVDYNTYEIKMDPDLLAARKDYFKLKTIARGRWFGEAPPFGQKLFSTGALRICTLLSGNGIDCRYIPHEELEKNLDTWELPDAVGFSAVCPTVPLCARLAVKIKEKDSGIQTFLGGAHAMVAAVQTRERFPCFDWVLPYEEEEAAAFLLKECAGAAGAVRLPEEYVDYSLLPEPISHYGINLFTSLGCKNHCMYCQDHRRRLFFNELDGGLGKIRELLEPGRPIHYFDSVFGLTEERRKRVCEELERLNHSFVISCDMRADEISADTVKRMAAGGIREIRMGMDSGDSSVLEGNNRGMGNDVLVKAARTIHEYSDIYVSVYTLTGLAASTPETIKYNEEMISFLLENRLIQEAKNGLYVPYPTDGVCYQKQGVFIWNQDWRAYDRQSYPVYDLPGYGAENIWRDYVRISRYIADIWKKVLDVQELDEGIKGYPEAFSYCYSINEEGEN